MGVENSGDLELQNTAIGFMSSEFSDMYASPGPMAVGMISVPKANADSLLNEVEPFSANEWDPHGDFSGPFPALGSGFISSQGFHCSSVAMGEQQIPTIPCFTSGGFPQTAAAFGAHGPVDLSQDFDRGVAKDSRSKKRKSTSGCGASISNSSMNTTQIADCKPPKGSLSPQSPKSAETKKDEKNPGDIPRKPVVKQGKEQRQIGEDGKEDYIHVRAKRGQATNSHSLAERVRREKISERMRFLQNLVPGCNKITGKAVMLDEIINYVQSLQRQVEFLSMKLATVSPELNYDIMQLLTKDMLPSGGGCSAAVGFGPGINNTCHSSGFAPQPVIQQEIFFHRISTPQEMLQISPIAQLQANSWDEELHNVMQMGYMPQISTGNRDREPPIHHD